MYGKPDGFVHVVDLFTKQEAYCLSDALEALPSDNNSGRSTKMLLSPAN